MTSNEEKVIARGYIGTVVHPSPGIVSSDSNRKMAGQRFVMKCAPTENTFQSLRVANHLRSAWSTLASSADDGTPLSGRLKKLASANQIDDYFVLPSARIRDLSLEPVSTTASTKPFRSGLATFMSHAGRCFDEYYKTAVPLQANEADLAVARHIIEGILLLHGAGIIHNDVQPHNVLIDHTGKPRLIDFETAALHYSDDRNRRSVLVDQIPMNTGRYIYFLLSGRLKHSKRRQIEFDWRRTARLFEQTWSLGVAGRSVARRAYLPSIGEPIRRLARAALLLRRGTDMDAAEAIDILLPTR
jgi:hypothetical protein